MCNGRNRRDKRGKHGCDICKSVTLVTEPFITIHINYFLLQLVTCSLQRQGVLSELKAQLRANVFAAVKEVEDKEGTDVLRSFEPVLVSFALAITAFCPKFIL